MKKIFAMIAIMLPMAVMAQEEKDTTVAIPETENSVRLAAELSKYGYANNDALSLIEAARISKQAGLTQEKRDVQSSSTAPLVSDGKKGNITLDPAQLLTDAKAKAGDDEVLLTLIDDVNKNVRGATGGPRYDVTTVNGNSYNTYRIVFNAGETAIATVIGDGDTDLDLYIYDANGNLIDKDDDYTDNCVCTWVPRWTGTFTIKIINRGRVYNRYVMRTN